MDIKPLFTPKPVLLGFTTDQRLHMADSVLELAGADGLKAIRMMAQMIEAMPKCYKIVNGNFVPNSQPEMVLALLQISFKELLKVKPMYDNGYTGEIPKKF